MFAYRQLMLSIVCLMVCVYWRLKLFKRSTYVFHIVAVGVDDKVDR